MVCVEYGDLLAVTLSYNRHHFDKVLVVTHMADKETIVVCENLGVDYITTPAFYENGAHFNKWKALEEGLDLMGREGLLCIMDPDVMWPKEIGPLHQFCPGRLYTPRRRLLRDVMQEIPPEEDWCKLELFNEREFAGYSQVFYGDDSRLPDPPWHEQNWIHAGGADSAFQNLWKHEEKIRPSWEVLHLGSPGLNWCGRTTRRRDGRLPVNADGRAESLHRLMRMRKSTGGYLWERL